MARQTLTAKETTGPWPTTGVDITETAANATDKEQTLHTGRELLFARNAGATPRVVTVTSKADRRTGRTGDVTDTVPADATVMLGPFEVDGFRQSNGMLYFEAAHSDIKWSVVRT
jgi:hypothetical protein